MAKESFDERRLYRINHLRDQHARWMLRFMCRGQADKAARQARAVAHVARDYERLRELIHLKEAARTAPERG